MSAGIETLISEALAGRTLANRELHPAQIKAIAETLAPIVAQAQARALEDAADALTTFWKNDFDEWFNTDESDWLRARAAAARGA